MLTLSGTLYTLCSRLQDSAVVEAHLHAAGGHLLPTVQYSSEVEHTYGPSGLHPKSALTSEREAEFKMQHV